METILLTGKNGFLGSRIYHNYQTQYNIIAPPHRILDITDERQCIDFVQACKPKYVLHTAAISDTGVCEKNPQSTYQVNVLGALHLAKACVLSKSKLIFMSSDQIYGGSEHNQPNREIDRIKPVTVYGKQKAEAEERLLSLLSDAVCLRLTWMFDLPSENFQVKPNFLTKIMNALEQKSNISLSDKELRCITYVKEVVENIPKIFTLPVGIYNAGSMNTLTTHALGLKVLEILHEEKWAEKYLQSTNYFRNLSINNDKIGGYGVAFSDSIGGILRCFSDHI